VFTKDATPTDGTDKRMRIHVNGTLFHSGVNLNRAMDGIGDDRSNWSAPYVMDPTDPETLYYGTQRVYKTTNGAGVWNPVSDDLTYGDHGGNYGTITTLAVAPSNAAIVYAGTDDGRVWRYNPLSGGWLDIGGSLPLRWVTRVAVDPQNALVAYVTFSGLRWEEPLSYVYRTDDGGGTWQDIGQDLPAAPVNAIVVDPDRPQTLYVGNDVGVYVSTNTGQSWEPLGQGLPRAPVLDLAFHQPTRTLVAGTHGRSMFAIIVSEPTAVEDAPPAARAPELAAAPNPFNPRTTLAFTLDRGGPVRLAVYDPRGHRLAVLVDEQRAAGRHEIVWDGRDDTGRALPSGLYLARLELESGVGTRKLVLAR